MKYRPLATSPLRKIASPDSFGHGLALVLGQVLHKRDVAQAVQQVTLVLGDAAAKGQAQFQPNLAMFLDDVDDGVFVEHPHGESRVRAGGHAALPPQEEVGFAHQATRPLCGNGRAPAVIRKLYPTLFDEIERVALSSFGEDQFTLLVGLEPHALADGAPFHLGEISKEGDVLNEIFLHGI
jgi:hypothetical protein